LNLIGDNGGGGMLLALGTVAAIFEASRSGLGQVIDVAMVDGAAILSTFFHGMLSAGRWSETRGSNFLDGGAPYYDAYETADGQYVSVGALEPHFYDKLLMLVGLADEKVWSEQHNRTRWPEMKEDLARLFRTKTRAEWCSLLEYTDACFSPVLRLSEAPDHPHNQHRGTFVEVDGVRQPAPAPRFSRTRSSIPRPPPHPGQHTDEVLIDLAFSTEEIDDLRRMGAVA
jgi:alpha-methylacyl-CoA racemase